MKAKFLWRNRQFSIEHIAMPFWGHLQVVSKTCWVILLLLTAAFADAAKVEDFMPKESILFVKLQDIDEVYGEIEISENWEKVLALLPDVSNWQQMQQGLAMLQGVLGTNALGILETVGYRTALAAWFDEAQAGLLQLGLVIHSGGNLDELQRLTKVVEGFVGMSGGNTLHLDAGVYQRVRYNALEINGEIFKYGFVDDFLVLGVGEGSFEKLLDVYRTEAPDIQENEEFNRALEKMGSGEVIVFVHTDYILTVLSGLDVWIQTRLPIFPLLFGRLNLLEAGPFLQVGVQFNPNLPENEIGMFLKKGGTLKTPNVLSNEDDLFVAVAPSILEGVWEFARTEMDKDATGNTYEAISFLEGLLNLDLEEDIMAGLTGELALSVPDLTRFDPEAVSSIRVEVDGAFALDAGNVETSGGIIFSPSNRMKWNQVGNSLSNLQSASVSQTDYKGTTVSGFASNIYYSEIDELFLMGFSEDQICTLIDGIKRKKKPSYLKQLPKTPTAFAQLNLARVLERGKGSPPADKLLVDSKEIPLLLAWLSVEDDVALLEMTLSEKETLIEMLAKLVPFFLWNMDVWNMDVQEKSPN